MTGFAEENVPYEPPLHKADFLRWVQSQERRHEFKDGRTIMQAGGTKRHNWIAVNFVTALKARLDDKLWAVGMADIAVEIGDDIRYPDVLVEPLTDDGTSLSTDKPTILVEILSPSSVAIDMNIKLAEYTSLPSLEVYVVVSQDETICWVWQRSGDNRAFTAKPVEIKGREKSIHLTTPAITLALADIYRGIGET